MRITVDAVQAPPPHALTQAEVKDLLAVVPREWVRFVKTVRLSAALPGNSRFVQHAIFSYGDNRLTIISRGLEADQVRREVLRELAVVGLGIKTSYGHKLSHEQLYRLDETVSPLLQQIAAAEQVSTSEVVLKAEEDDEEAAVEEALDQLSKGQSRPLSEYAEEFEARFAAFYGGHDVKREH